VQSDDDVGQIVAHGRRRDACIAVGKPLNNQGGRKQIHFITADGFRDAQIDQPRFPGLVNDLPGENVLLFHVQNTRRNFILHKFANSIQIG